MATTLSLNDINKIQDAVEVLCTVLDCNYEELMDCLEGQLLSEEECSEIKFSMQ